MSKPRSLLAFARTWCLLFELVLIGITSVRAQAQEYVTLVSFTNTWRYNQAGQNLGTNWVASDYDDTVDPWQSGPALLGVESPLGGNYNFAVIIPNTIPTPLSLTSAGGTNGTNITFYFRTQFINTLTNLTGVDLWATNLVDDGCAIYLNGTRAGNVRLTNANPSYLTLANSGPPSEGQYDPVRLSGSLLVQGTNTLAVEVHQNAINSADIAFAMKLVAIVPSILNITNQPQSVTAVIGDAVTFSIGVSGGPVVYRWYRNSVLFPNGTNATSSFTAAQNLAGSYYCVVSNNITPPKTSSVVTLTIVQDLFGPEPLTATVSESGSTNIIVLVFDETMQITTTSPNRDPNNYRVVASGTTNTFVPITNVVIAGGFNAVLRLNTSSNWVIGNGYHLVLNNLVDTKGNVIAPDTVVPISWPRRYDLLAPDAVWSFHAAAIFDFAVYNDDWTSPEYVEGPWWAEGPGIFYGGPVTLPQCLGPAQTLVGYQPEPILFRTTFQWPSDAGPTANATITRAIDDGLVLYLNGQEIQRINVVGPVVPWARASTNVPNANCQSNITVAVTNLRPGTNWLAAALVQAATEADVVFGLRLGALIYAPSPVPDNPPPVLAFSPLGTNAARLSWTGYGYSLETSTNLALGFESYPAGPWLPATNMSNPYTNYLSGPERFFRLKK